jgi:hypothetical protein
MHTRNTAVQLHIPCSKDNTTPVSHFKPHSKHTCSSCSAVMQPRSVAASGAVLPLHADVALLAAVNATDLQPAATASRHTAHTRPHICT